MCIIMRREPLQILLLWSVLQFVRRKTSMGILWDVTWIDGSLGTIQCTPFQCFIGRRSMFVNKLYEIMKCVKKKYVEIVRTYPFHVSISLLFRYAVGCLWIRHSYWWFYFGFESDWMCKYFSVIPIGKYIEIRLNMIKLLSNRYIMPNRRL